MEKFFVYYSDNYDEFGIEAFGNEKEALSFIEKRMSNVDRPNLKNYLIYKGRELALVEETVVTKVRIEV